MRRLITITLALVLAIILIATPVFAISEPDSTPTVEEKYCYRNVLETGDFLCIIYENTPYSSTPNMSYSEAFIWRLIDTDGETELAQASGYNYHESGYGYNVISFYLDASEFSALGMTWGSAYYLRLSGTPAAFSTPPVYNFSLSSGDYSTLTDSDDVEAELTTRILALAQSLDTNWGLDTDYSLLSESEIGAVLSIYGQAFFRGAVYGLQSMTPGAFPFVISSITASDRTWVPDYVDALVVQYTGTYIEDALTAGETFFDVSYNLMGIILTLLLCFGLVMANWSLAGGNLWKGMVDASAMLIIASRMALFGLGELGLLAALCWLYISGKIWKVI